MSLTASGQKYAIADSLDFVQDSSEFYGEVAETVCI